MPHDEKIVPLFELNDNEYNHKFTQLMKQIENPIVKVFLSHQLINISGTHQEKMKYLGYIVRGNVDDWKGDPAIKKEMDEFWEVMRKQVIC